MFDKLSAGLGEQFLDSFYHRFPLPGIDFSRRLPYDISQITSSRKLACCAVGRKTSTADARR
jgi:hypothetical protein